MPLRVLDGEMLIPSGYHDDLPHIEGVFYTVDRPQFVEGGFSFCDDSTNESVNVLERNAWAF